MTSDMASKAKVLDIPVTVSTQEMATEMLIDDAKQSLAGYVCMANVHMLTTARHDNELASVLKDARYVLSDGMPVVWALRWQGFSQASRVAGPDLVPQLCRRSSDEGIPVYFYGGTPETINVLMERITKDFPELRVVGAESPPMLAQHPAADPDAIERITNSGARFVFVGLGCPKQEFWMASHARHVPAIMLGVGAAFDFLAGTKQRAPSWMQRHGLEWFFRLCSEPSRLWKRYLVTNSIFLWALILDKVKNKSLL